MCLAVKLKAGFFFFFYYKLKAVFILTNTLQRNLIRREYTQFRYQVYVTVSKFNQHITK